MPEVKIFKSKWKAIKLILLSLPFLLAIVFFNHYDNGSQLSPWTYWPSVLILGCILGFGVFNLLDERPEIVINEYAIFNRMTFTMFDKSENKGVTKWENIKKVSYKVYRGSYKGLPLSKKNSIIIFLYKPNVKEKSHLSKYVHMPLEQLRINGIKLTQFIDSMRLADIPTKIKLLADYNQFMESNSPANSNNDQ
ncbi:hypothetical protein [Mucilaginibacter sp. HD30]